MSNPLSVDEKLNLIMQAQNRLFWLITQGTGVARYGSDVTFFSMLAANSGYPDKDHLAGMHNSYNREDIHNDKCKYYSAKSIADPDELRKYSGMPIKEDSIDDV